VQKCKRVPAALPSVFAAIAFMLSGIASAEALFAGDATRQVTTAQVERGQVGYALNCQSCHGAALEGTQFGPALKGATFEGHWRGRARTAFSEQLRTTMPPGKLGSLSSDTYDDVEAFILQASAGKAAAPGVTSASVPKSASKSGGEAASMMGPMQRRDDPLYLATMKARKDELAAITPVTDAMLESPAPADWLMWRRTYDSLGYSPLHQINRSNVERLRPAWSWVLPPSSNEITPLVHDGVMFVYSGAAIQALDAVSGDLLWQYTRSVPGGLGFGASHGKALAVHGENLFAATADGHMIALSFRTGHLVWDHEVIPGGSRAGLALNGGPIVAKGMVIFGVSLGVSNPGGCFIVGLDAASGQERWRFDTIARPGQPGGDTWNGAPVQERFGGGVWTAGSYDPQLDLVYFGIGNTYDTATLLEPRPGAASVSANDALYTDSTVALRPETGALAWYFQHQKRDVWDLDWVFEQSVVTMPVAGKPRKLIVTGSKTALFDAIDAATGAFVFSKDLGVQNVVTAVDAATGDKTVNPAVEPEAGKPKLMCPNSVGARNWPATALNPETQVLYVPILENCADFTYTPRGAAETAAGGIDMHFSARTPPDHDGNYGRLVAVDLQKRQILWAHRQRIPPASAALATAGGLVFAGDVDRYFSAHDARTGKVLWRTRLDAAAESFPITFSAGGRQYLAVVAGSGSPFGTAGRSFVPDVVAPAAGVTVVVFELSR
jgi:alcohol dehydrogenase (cytochrome c)